LDGAATGLAGVYALSAGDAVYLGDYDLSLAGMGVYVRPDNPVLQHRGLIPGKPDVYGNAETIRGMTFLGPLGTSAQFNVVAWAQLFGLSSDDVTMLHMEFGPAVNAFLSGQGDALPTSPPFSFTASEAGYVPVADMGDVTGMDLSNGFVFRREVVENRREDVMKYMTVIYQVLDMLAADDELYAEYAFRFYNDNGRPHTQEMVAAEVEQRDFIGTAYASRDDYSFGSTMIGMGSFYVSDGKIEPEDFPNIMAAMDTSFLEEIIGKPIRVFEPSLQF
jgi:ABC-type nitrate/sulfonate/bicarbonate transport system substrate-binding protein